MTTSIAVHENEDGLISLSYLDDGLHHMILVLDESTKTFLKGYIDKIFVRADKDSGCVMD